MRGDGWNRFDVALGRSGGVACDEAEIVDFTWGWIVADQGLFPTHG
jgi:hypothetical protein